MRVALTGATGFLGGRLARALVDRGDVVLGISRDPARAAARPPLGLEWAGWDPAAVAAFGPDVLVHCSTAYGRGRAREPAGELREANVERPLRLWQAVAERGARLIAADTFFGKPGLDYAHLRDYTATKRAFREAAAAVADRCGRPGVFARIEHMYGAGDDPSKGIPALVRQIVTGSGRLALTDGLQQRDFVHVSDVAAAFALIAALDWTPAAHDVEIGTGTAHSLRHFLETVHRRSGSRVELGFGDLPRREGEPVRSAARAGPLRAAGWSCRTSLEQGIDEMIEEARR